MAKQINLAYASKCAVCGKQMAKGDAAMYSASAAPGKKVWHPACHSAPQAQQAPSQGATPADGSPTTSRSSNPVRAALKFRKFEFVSHFSGPGELAADFTPAPTNAEKYQNWCDEPDAVITGTPLTWWGFKDFQTGLTAFRTGWPEGVQRLEESLAKVDLALEMHSRRRKPIWADAGDEVDLQRVYSGKLDRAFRRTRRQNRTAPGVVTIVVSSNLNYTQKSEQMFWAGAAVLKLTEQMEAAGHSVEVLLVDASKAVYRNGQGRASIVTAKEAGAPVDMGALAGVVCSSMTDRYFVLRRAFIEDLEVMGGMGQPVTDLPLELMDRERIVVAHAGGMHDANDAAGWVANAIEAIEEQETERLQEAA